MILVGDCITHLRQLPDATAQTCITSPPYFGLRDYGVKGQHGLERFHDCNAWARGKRPCRQCYVCGMRRVFTEVYRVLRKDGTLWLNMGDSTASSGGLGNGGNSNRQGRGYQQRNVRPTNVHGLAPKNLMGMPWRLAFALQADGWILRQDIIWEKRTPMPETAKDRPARAHEYLFLLVKQRRYYFDERAIAEPTSDNSHARFARAVPPKGAANREHVGAGRKAYKAPTGWDQSDGRGHRQQEGRYPAPRVKNNPSFDSVMGAPPKEQGRIDQQLKHSEALGGGAGWRADPDSPTRAPTSPRSPRRWSSPASSPARAPVTWCSIPTSAAAPRSRSRAA